MSSKWRNYIYEFVAILFFIAIIYRVETHGDGRATDRVIVLLLGLVAGTMLLLQFLHLLQYLIQWYLKRQARKILMDLLEFNSVSHEFRIVAPEHFPDQDRPYVEEMTSTLHELGFESPGDIENLAHSRIYPDSAYAERGMVSQDRSTYALFYSARFPTDPKAHRRSWPWKHYLFLYTRFEGDDFFITEMESHLPGREIAHVFGEQMPWESGVSALVLRHGERISEWQKGRDGVRIISISGVESLLDSKKALQLLFLRDRKLNGLLTAKEIRGLCEYCRGKNSEQAVDRWGAIFESVLREKRFRPEPAEPS